MQTLDEELSLLRQIVDFSPYLSTESRLFLEKQIVQLSDSISVGEVNTTVGQKLIVELDERAASDEVHFLMAKISHLNPSSPRLELLEDVACQLDKKEISPDETRKEIQRIMRY